MSVIELEKVRRAKAASQAACRYIEDMFDGAVPTDVVGLSQYLGALFATHGITDRQEQAAFIEGMNVALVRWTAGLATAGDGGAA